MAGVLVLDAAGTVAAGVDWPIRWWQTVTALRAELNHYGYLDAHSPSLFQFGVSPATIGLALLVAGAFGYWIWRCRSLRMKFAIAVIGSIIRRRTPLRPTSRS